MNEEAAFVVPHWTSDIDQTGQVLAKTIVSITTQQDERWRIILVDDASGDPRARDHLLTLKESLPADKLEIIFHEQGVGPGGARNTAIARASELGAPFVMFLDADDIAADNRLRLTRDVFAGHDDVSVVYSTFDPIDESDEPIPFHELTPSIREILITLRFMPPQGENVWLEMGTESGYANLTSATSVRTDLAMLCPFPMVGVSEDFHTFMRYSAYGGKYHFLPNSATKYRIKRSTVDGGSSSRGREHDFYLKKARTDTAGFLESLRHSLSRDEKIDPYHAMKRMNMRLCMTLLDEGKLDLAARFLRRAQRYERLQETRNRAGAGAPG